jgi:hypothetical protein
VAAGPGRAGSTVVLAGVLVVAVGFLIEFLGEYGELTQLYQFGSSTYKFDEQLLVVGYFFLGVGVLVVGVGWSLSRQAFSSAHAEAPRSNPRRRALEIALVLGGTALVAAGALFIGIIEEEALSGVNLHLAIWTESILPLLAGMGLFLWGAGWFLSKAS